VAKVTKVDKRKWGNLMRIWDVNPGYLNRQSLLSEHREIHAIFSIITKGKKAYSRHPETLRWYGKLTVLKKRHDLLVSEMTLRGFDHFTHMEDRGGAAVQDVYILTPAQQFDTLKEKYLARKQGRIPLPVNSQQLWAQHKYSILARDPGYYQTIGPLVSAHDSKELFTRLAKELVELLTVPPPPGRLLNAVQHMWGYVSSFVLPGQTNMDLQWLMDTIRRECYKHKIVYLMQSTALSDLAVYISNNFNSVWRSTITGNIVHKYVTPSLAGDNS
jgi:hypothetical protein